MGYQPDVIHARLARLYGEAAAAELLPRIEALIERRRLPACARSPRFDERTAVLIAYPDHLEQPDEPPLATLAAWCRRRLRGLVSTIHVLPFHPSTSYEGYAITDYRSVDPRLGTWDDLAGLARDFELMFDLVLNHCSASHPWFGQFLAGEAPGRDYFITVDDPGAQWLFRVGRARGSPLLHPFATASGTRHVWTTYSADLIDLDWRRPAVLLEFLDLLLDAAAHGARIVRLDAFVYIWKEPGSSCIDRPECHELVALFQELLAAAGAGGVALLPSITNVTQADNYRYFGDPAQRKADLIYHLPLSALLLQALYSGDATILRDWLTALPPAPTGCAYLNLSATHDGIGLSWLDGLLPPSRIDELVRGAAARGALLSSRPATEGSAERPWEVNATWFSACGELAASLLATQAVVLALRGVPALYLPLLLAGRNDHAKVARDADNRAINRGRLDLAAWQEAAARPTSAEARVLAGLARMLRARAACPAFHPEAPQRIAEAGHPAVLAIERDDVLCLTNLSGQPVRQSLEREGVDLLGSGPVLRSATLAPYGTLWVARARGDCE